MRKLNLWSVGAALALTVLVTYTACTVVFVAFPDASVNFLNSLFHGLDFRRLQQPEGGFSAAGFGGVAMVWAAVGFMVGVLYACFYNLLARVAAAAE